MENNIFAYHIVLIINPTEISQDNMENSNSD